MYLQRLTVENLKSFKNNSIEFIHRERDFAELDYPFPRLPNVTVLLGDNGTGKTSILKAIAVAAAGPLAEGFPDLPEFMVQRWPNHPRGQDAIRNAEVRADFLLHDQDKTGNRNMHLKSVVRVVRETINVQQYYGWIAEDRTAWNEIHADNRAALMVMGYGAHRRVPRMHDTSLPMDQFRGVELFYQRIQSLFDDNHTLYPLYRWLPALQGKPRFQEVIGLIGSLLRYLDFQVTGELEGDQLVVKKGKLGVPQSAASTGYRTFLEWTGDLLFHLHLACPEDQKLSGVKGIVLVDEVDLHLHPKWQLEILNSLCSTFPNLQFILTTHSPLVVGTAEWMNLVMMSSDENNLTSANVIRKAIHGLDANQLLKSDFFGLNSTRSPDETEETKRLQILATTGDPEALQQLMLRMNRGTETKGNSEQSKGRGE